MQGTVRAELGVTLLAGILPRSWSHYTVPAGMTVIQWVSDFSERIKQLQNISLAAASGGAKELKVRRPLLSAGGVGGPGSSGTSTEPCGRREGWCPLLTGSCSFPQNIHVCLGGLFVPEAYITATRQYVAQANSWSLEELCLEVHVTTSQSATLDACSFGVTGESGSGLGAASPPQAVLPAWLPVRVSEVAGGSLSRGRQGRPCPRRFEAPGGHLQQQQAVPVPRHLHGPPSDAAALGQADQRREEG